MAQPILLIEDDIACRKLIARRLKLAGEECVEATTGEEGLRLLAHQEFRAVLLNLNLPGISGEDLLPIIKDRWPTMPIWVVTFAGFVMVAAGQFIDFLFAVDSHDMKRIAERAVSDEAGRKERE